MLLVCFQRGFLLLIVCTLEISLIPLPSEYKRQCQHKNWSTQKLQPIPELPIVLESCPVPMQEKTSYNPHHDGHPEHHY